MKRLSPLGMSEIPWNLMSIGQTAMLIEVSAPKPGNVSRAAEFSDMDYRNFLVSASFIGRALHDAAVRGVALAQEKIVAADVALGNLIQEATRNTLSGLNRRNTVLGTILMYIPLTVAMGAMLEETGVFTTETLKRWLDVIISQTTVEDTVDLYRAFDMANPGGSMIREQSVWKEVHDRFDIDNPNVIQNVLEDRLTLHELFEISRTVDEISDQWASRFTGVLDEVLPHLRDSSSRLEDLEEGVVETFVWLLAKRPDGLIVKKAGAAEAERVRDLAEKAVRHWKGDTSNLLADLDSVLRSDGNTLNPGTTADLVSTAVFCRLVEMSYGNT